MVFEALFTETSNTRVWYNRARRKASIRFPAEMTSMSALPPESTARGGSVAAIAVPGGDVAALYEAVYDEHGRPRDNVTIDLAPGVFRLDPSGPFGGRLVLGNKTILRSTLKMALDGEGVPLVDERG
jgi:hypothetical protein